MQHDSLHRRTLALLAFGAGVAGLSWVVIRIGAEIWHSLVYEPVQSVSWAMWAPTVLAAVWLRCGLRPVSWQSGIWLGCQMLSLAIPAFVIAILLVVQLNLGFLQILVLVNVLLVLRFALPLPKPSRQDGFRAGAWLVLACCIMATQTAGLGFWYPRPIILTPLLTDGYVGWIVSYIVTGLVWAGAAGAAIAYGRSVLAPDNTPDALSGSRDTRLAPAMANSPATLLQMIATAAGVGVAAAAVTVALVAISSGPSGCRGVPWGHWRDASCSYELAAPWVGAAAGVGGFAFACAVAAACLARAGLPGFVSAFAIGAGASLVLVALGIALPLETYLLPDAVSWALLATVFALAGQTRFSWQSR